MAGLTKLAKASRNALANFLGLIEDETLMVLCDENKREIGFALYEAGKKLGNDAILVEMSTRKEKNEEPPDAIAEMMQKVDAVFCATTKSIYKTSARREASRVGVRIATLHNITPEAFARSMSANYKLIRNLTHYLIEKMKTIYNIKVITELGTDIVMPVKRRRIHTNTGILRTIGESGMLPSGEIKIAPIETKSNGVIVIDAALNGFGVVEEPITFTVRKGYAERINGKNEAKTLSKNLSTLGHDARALGVFGIGLNNKAELSGDIHEDRIVLGTVHFGFGKSTPFGGKIDIDSYVEGVVKKPTVYFDDELIMQDGVFIEDFDMDDEPVNE
jgi:aminopeptidase